MSRRNHKKKQVRSRCMPKPAPPTPVPTPSCVEVPSFCAYYGPQGDMCTNTTQLQSVLTLKGFATLLWAACPEHRAEVYKRALAFVEACHLKPQILVFNYDDDGTSRVGIAVQKKLVYDS